MGDPGRNLSQRGEAVCLTQALPQGSGTFLARCPFVHFQPESASAGLHFGFEFRRAC